MPIRMTLIAAALAAAAGLACAATPALPGPAFPSFDNAEQVRGACDKA